MHESILPKGSRKLLETLGRETPSTMTGWTLAGGTGLALSLGHRTSEDFDFFRNKPADLERIRKTLAALGRLETLQEAPHTLTMLVDSVKMSFFIVEDPFLFTAKPWRLASVADPRDIALMKLVAISSRGTRKDFVDLYVILQSGLTLRECARLFPRKYRTGRANLYHILKSLTYFEDAEKEPLPRMRIPFRWNDCKAFFIREAHAMLLPPE